MLAGALSAGCSGVTLAQGKGADFYEDALRRFDNKDYAGAVIQLKNTIKAEPAKLAAHLLLGKALMQTGDVAAAEVAFNEALRLGVNRSEVVNPLAQAMLAQGKQVPMLALGALQPAGLPLPVQQSLLLLRAAAQSDLGDHREALNIINQARQIDGSKPEVWLAEVPIRIRSRQFTEAHQAADRALALAPQNAEAIYFKGSIAHVQGDLGAAMAAYAKVLQADPGHVEALVARIGLHLDMNRTAEASQDLAALQKASPKEPRAAYLRALLAERQGQVAETKAALLEVTSLLDPVPPAFMRYRPQLLMLNGLAHYGLNEPEKAKQYLEAFLKVQPGSPVSRLLARIYTNEGNAPLAIRLLETYLQANPGDGQALNLLGSVYMSQGRSAKATQLLQQALKTQDNPEYRTTLGLSMLGSGQTAGAINELEAAYRKDPKQITAGIALTQLYLLNQRVPQAVALAQSLVKLKPNHGGLHFLLGNALAQSGQVPAARSAYEKAVALAPDLAQARLQLARMDINAKALPAAELQLNALLKAYPKYADAMAEMARVADLKGQGAEALRWLVKARESSGRNDLRWNFALIELHLRSGKPTLALEEAKIAAAKKPDDLTMLMMYSRVQLALGDAKGAQSLLTSATRIAEFNAPMQTQIASLMLEAKHLPGAAYSLDKALSGQPGYLPAQTLLARVELLQGETAKAEQRARQIVQNNPRSAAGHDVLGDIAAAQGKGDAALAAYRQAQQIEPGTATTLKLMGALTSQGRAKDALDAGQQRLRKQPADTSVQKAVADIHARAGQYAEAARNYAAAIKTQPADVEALNSLANVQAQLKDPAAVQTAEKALSLARDNALVIDTLGWVLAQQGQTDRALPLLRDARLREPGNPEIRYHLAKVLAQTGRKAEAKEELTQALKISRQFEGSKDAEQLLNSLP